MEIVLIIVLAFALLGMTYLYNKVRVELRTVKRSDFMMRAFLRNYSHEVHSPLKVIERIADIMLEKDLYLSKNEKHDMGDQLHYNVNVISLLLDEVMVFTDADAKSHQLKDEMFSPNALCRRCLEANMHNTYLRDQVRLNFQRDMDDEFFVKSDRHVVDLILNKLILNACRFTQEGDIMVGCNTTESPGYLTIFVSDSGGGIPEHRKDNIFTFFDDPADMMDEAELDLSICQRLAQKLGGDLLIDQNQQKGTRVLLLLPLK